MLQPFTLRLSASLAGALMLWTSLALAQSPDIEPAVLAQYPATLLAEDVADGNLAGPRGCYGILEQDNAGVPLTVLAGYANSSGTGTVRILSRQQDGTYQVSWMPPPDWQFLGTSCDITHGPDSTAQEWLVSFGSMRASHDTLFEFGQGGLVPLSPNDLQSGYMSKWFNVRFFDITLSGEARAFSGRNLVSVYRRENGVFVYEGMAAIAVEFKLRSPAPVVDRARFDAREPAVSGYRLRVTNGEPGGQGRLSATIRVNGISVLTATQLSANIEALDVAVPPGVIHAGENEITAEMTGDVGGRFIVVVEVLPPQ